MQDEIAIPVMPQSVRPGERVRWTLANLTIRLDDDGAGEVSKCDEGSETEMLVYHTSSRSFRGATHEEIIHQIFQEIRRGLDPDVTFEQWWSYQRKLWKLPNGQELPSSPDEPECARAFIDLMVELGAINEGQKPE